MLEFDEDDDFGDLYTDLEVKESRTLNKLLQEKQNTDASEQNETEEEQKRAAVVVEGGRDWNGSENKVESESESECESEDDLNIVLNDNEEDNFDYNCKVNAANIGGGYDNEDGNGGEEVDEGNDEMESGVGGCGGKFGCYGGGYGARVKHMRSHSAIFSNNMKSNGSAGPVSYFTSVRDNWEDKSRSPHFGTSSIGTQSWHYFSLPRSRTILDVNIDALEWKPWRHPGADITDFFNFGFDEDSWKCYCNHLDRCREKRTEVNGYPACKPWSYTKPKGKAIKVKEGIGERQPSVGVRHPVDRDLDVIIEIPVQDIEEILPNYATGAVDESSSVVHEASDNKESGDVTGNDGQDVLCFSSASEDELPRLEVSTEETQKSVPERCIKHTAACDCIPACMDSDNGGSLQVFKADKHHYQEVSEGNSDGSSEATRYSDDPKKSVSNVRPLTASCRKDLESSYGEHSQYSPSQSPSQSHDLTSRNGAYVEADEFHGHSKRVSPNSVSEVRECVKYDHHSSKDRGSHDIKVKPGDYEYFARSRCPIQRNHKFHQRKSSRVGELKSYLDYQDALYVSDLEKFHDLPHPTIGYFNRRNKHHGFDYSKREDFLYSQGSKQSFYHGGEKFCDYQSSDAYARNPHRIGPLDSGYERDLPHRQIINGKHHFHGQRIQSSEDDGLEQNLDQFESRRSVEEMDSLHYDGPRQFVSEQSPFVESRNHTQRKCKLQELHFKRRRANNNFIPERAYCNKYMQGNYICIRNDRRERDVIELEYDRLFPYARREVESPVRSKGKFDSPLNINEPCRLTDCEDKKVRCTGKQFSFLFYEEKRSVGRGRGQGVSLSRGEIFGRQGIRMRDNCFERYSESKFGVCAGVFHSDEYMENPDDQDDFATRRLYPESDVLRWKDDKYSSWHADSDFQGERTLHHFNRTSRSTISDAKHGHGPKLIGYESEHRCNMLRKGNNSSQFLQSSNITCRYIEPTHPGSKNSTDKHMVVGNRKSSRCVKGGSIICNDRYEYLDWNDHSDRRIFKDLDEPHCEKIVRADKDRSYTLDDAAWFHKFPDAKGNESPDVEEGQIITKDFDEEPEKKTCASKDTTSTIGTKNLSSENPKILEMIAKMEKRRERFKQPLRNISEKNGKPSADEVETIETKKPERPARKRKWIAS